MIDVEQLIRQIRTEEAIMGESNILAHAERELKFLNDGDEMNEMMRGCILQLLFVFASQGHSGFSAGYAAIHFERLAKFQPIGPLTGEDNEWTLLDYDDHMKWQNKRCSSVFKRADGTAYNSEGRVFRDPDGSCFTSRDSSVDITFPYNIPEKPEYVDVKRED